MPISKWISMPQLITAVIGGLIVAVVIGGFNYWLQIPLLRSQVDDLRTSQSNLASQLSEVQQKYMRMEGFLEAKLNYNYSAFVAISNQKKIPQSEFKAALPMLEHNPKEASTYLMKKLNFSPNEVKAVFTLPKEIGN
jgi:hypothetical protein